MKAMMNSTLKMTIPPEKRKEVLQTFRAILNPIRSEQGCVSCNCYVDVEEENCVLFMEEWNTEKDLDAHLTSVHFGVLVGAMKLLNKEPEIRFSTIAATASAPVAVAVRRR